MNLISLFLLISIKKQIKCLLSRRATRGTNRDDRPYGLRCGLKEIYISL